MVGVENLKQREDERNPKKDNVTHAFSVPYSRFNKLHVSENQANQFRLVVYPCIFNGFYIPAGCLEF